MKQSRAESEFHTSSKRNQILAVAKGRHGPAWRAWRSVARGALPDPALVPSMLMTLRPHVPDVEHVLDVLREPLSKVRGAPSEDEIRAIWDASTDAARPHRDLARIARGKHGPAWRAWRSVARRDLFDLDLVPHMIQVMSAYATPEDVARWLPGVAVQWPDPSRTHDDLARIARGRHGPAWRAWRALAKGEHVPLTEDMVRVIYAQVTWGDILRWVPGADPSLWEACRPRIRSVEDLCAALGAGPGWNLWRASLNASISMSDVPAMLSVFPPVPWDDLRIALGPAVKHSHSPWIRHRAGHVPLDLDRIRAMWQIELAFRAARR